MLHMSRILVGVVFFAGAAVSAQAQEDAGFDVEKIECGDVMILSGIDRDTTLAFMHGYIVGKDGATSADAAKMANSTDGFLAQCIENPNANAIETMRAAMRN